jgi:hypothetical protein
MKIFMLALLLFQQPTALITEYDEFNSFTKIKTDKLYVLDSETEKIQFTFLTVCKGNQTKDCEKSPFAAIGVLLKSNYLTFSKSLKAIADGERFDLGEATLLKTEPQDGFTFLSLTTVIPSDVFQKFGKAKTLKMQLGGVLAFTFSDDQVKEIRDLALKIGR